jgi:hypothetical protein
MVSTRDKDRRPERWKYDQVPLDQEDDDEDADDTEYLAEDKDALKPQLASSRIDASKG